MARGKQIQNSFQSRHDAVTPPILSDLVTSHSGAVNSSKSFMLITTKPEKTHKSLTRAPFVSLNPSPHPKKQKLMPYLLCFPLKQRNHPNKPLVLCCEPNASPLRIFKRLFPLGKTLYCYKLFFIGKKCSSTWLKMERERDFFP